MVVKVKKQKVKMAEGEEELKSLLMKMKEKSVKAGLKLNIQKINILASGSITSRQIDGETMQICRVTIYSLVVLLSQF